VQEYFSCLREVLLVEVVSFGDQVGKQGEMPVRNWRAYLNEIMVRDACDVQYLLCFCWFQAMGGIIVCSFSRILHGVCACLLDLYHG